MTDPQKLFSKELQDVRKRFLSLFPDEKGRTDKFDRKKALSLGIPSPTFNHICNRNGIPGTETLLRVSKGMGVNLDWILTGRGVPTGKKEPSGPTELKMEIVDRWTKKFYDLEGGKQLDNYIPIPILADAAAAGSPREIKDDDVESYAVIYKRWCKNPDNFTCVKIVGDSMHPILEKDSIVAINHTQRDPKVLDGKMAAFRSNGGVTIKWLKLVSENLVIAYPENKDSKEFYSFRDEEIDRAIIGKIEWWWGRQK